jgi:hypothetical protein
VIAKRIPPMIRRPLIALLAVALVAPAIAAPVPRVPPPADLTPELVEGTWLYTWSDWGPGVICFNRDGTFVSSFESKPGALYVGTWCAKGDTVTIFERCQTVGGPEPEGPHHYARFDFIFEPKGYPKLTGRSNGTEPVALWNRKR